MSELLKTGRKVIKTNTKLGCVDRISDMKYNQRSAAHYYRVELFVYEEGVTEEFSPYLLEIYVFDVNEMSKISENIISVGTWVEVKYRVESRRRTDIENTYTMCTASSISKILKEDVKDLNTIIL